ncbi:MAG: TonB-dependent receptor [Pseudomonadota bacterium]
MFAADAAQAQSQATVQPAPTTPTNINTGAGANQARVNSDEIVITGTRRTDRTVTNSASPVDVISAQELTNQPTANLLDTIKNIVPSFYVPSNAIADASTFVRSPSLRGLPGDEVLVQINGKRMNRSALVQVYTGGDTALSFGSQSPDISAIPAIAIKNLQILRDGATAQYGSDAIAGVMNFGIINDRKGIEVQGRWGRFYDHGDTRLDGGQSRQIAAKAGVGIGATGFIDVAGEWYKDDGTSTGKTRPVAAIFAQDYPNLATQLPNYPLPVQIWGNSPQHGWKGMVNAGVDVSSNSQLYVTGLAAYNKANESFNYRSPIRVSKTDPRTFDVNGVGHNLNANQAFTTPYYLTPCPANNATCPAGGFVKDNNVFLFTDIYPAGFTPRFVGVTKERWGTAGWKGSLDGGLTWDLSGTLAKNTLALSMYQSENASYGPLSQTSFQFGTLSQKEANANLDMTYPVNLGLASPVTLAWGAEYRKETYGSTEGDVQSYSGGPYAVAHPLFQETAPGVFTQVGSTAAKSPGASGYGGTSPTYAGSWSNWSWGAYGDVEADVTDKLSMGLAGRYENYNSFGGSFVYKVNGIYRVSPALSVRATLGTGFHAPSPGQINDAILTTNFVAGNQVQTGTYPVDSPISRYFGSVGLKPEKSKNYGAGVVLKPTSALTMTIDGYIINVRDRIGISRTYSVTAADILAQPELAAVGEGGDVNFFTNAFNTSTKGIDVVGTWRHNIFDGNLTTTLAYNYNKSKVTKFDPAVISDAQRIDIAHLAPNHRATLSANFLRGPWMFNARENYYGWWRDENDYPGQKFGAKFTTDADISYTFMQHFTLTLGANNIFNTRPDKIANSAANPIYAITGSTADGQVYPRLGGPFGINGGFYYVRVRVKY